MEVQIIEVKTKKQLRKFIDFAYDHYKEDANYVPDLYSSLKWMLTKLNPFLKHSEIKCFLAFFNNKLAGRITTIYNKTHLDKYSDDTGFFGFFESIDNQLVANALLKSAFGWLQNKGLSSMIGPTNLTTNDSCGILVEGFDTPPVVLMPYNKPYYDKLFSTFGLSKSMDLFSYDVNGDKLENYHTVIKKYQNRLNDNKVIIRPIDYSNFDKEIGALRLAYNEANEKNWGFVPLNEEEFKAMAIQLKTVTPKELSLVAEKNGTIIGFMIVVPDLNHALIKIRKGRLFPFGLFKLLWFRRKISRARILILGVIKDHSNIGIDILLYNQMNINLKKRGIYQTEACYVMESNKVMNSILKKLDGIVIKKYRIYVY